MSLGELYQALVIDHAKQPRNAGALSEATHRAARDNPLCGDRVSLALKLSDGRVQAARFQGEGCAISQAAASMMTLAIEGRTPAECAELEARVEGMLYGDTAEGLGELAALAGVRDHPARVKCALLAFQALRAALAAG